VSRAAVLLLGYSWLGAYDAAQSLERRIAPPAGFERASLPADSFGGWLRGLPLKEGRPPVFLHDGRRKSNQEAHWAVVDVDAGARDLQQCADAVMRLRAEYLFAQGRLDEIGFRFTSGDPAPYARWAAGDRPKVRGSAVSWARSARADSSYEGFRRYLDTVFMYAGSASLAKELGAPVEPRDVEAGDVFIQGGFPGHAVLVVDVAVHPRTRARVFLLAQSYMPAQDVHVLRNPARDDSPWYAADFGDTLVTPEWTFRRGDLRRF
jgi:hypothetical protein